MPVRSPGRRAGSGIALLQVKRQLSGSANRSLNSSINLTALVDFMSTIVIFLLMNFSSEGDLSQNAPDVLPPDAAFGLEAKRVPIIAISPTVVTFEGRIMEQSSRVLAEDDNYEIPKLAEALKLEQETFKALRSEEFKGEILIQADQNLPYKLVRRVLVASARAGYHNISYLVRAASPGKKD